MINEGCYGNGFVVQKKSAHRRGTEKQFSSREPVISKLIAYDFELFITDKFLSFFFYFHKVTISFYKLELN